MRERGSRWKVGLSVGKLAARRLVGARVGERDIQLGETLTDQLDQMKGLAMKLGQIVSYMDVPLPEVVQERMARLQSGQHGMSERETIEAFQNAWGDDFSTRFESLELVPFAAASIGQVHRARYRGRDVVVKLQYPDVAQGFRQDLGSLNRIASLASLASAVDGQAIVRELSMRLDEECDYVREGQAQVAFRELFSLDSAVVVPDVYLELGGRTTLVTSYAQGVTYERARDFPDPVRQQLAQALVRFSYRSLLCACAIQADPHPGNFLFTEDGRLICLDFGCVRTFDVPFIELLREMIRSLRDDDRAKFRAVVIELGMVPRPRRFDFEHHFSMMHHLHLPLLSTSFRFSSEFVKKGLDFNGPSSPNARTMNMPPEYIWVARLSWGLWSLLARLKAEIRVKDDIEGLLAEPVRPLDLGVDDGGPV